MVTDEELSKIVREAMERNKKDPPLSEKTDKELMDYVQEIESQRKIIKTKIEKVWERYWEFSRKERKLKRIKNTALTIKGSRKGKSCPAHKGNTKRGIGYPECEARRGFQSFYDDDELYRKYCSTCKLTLKTIEKRLTFKRVFDKDVKYHGR